MAVPYVHWWAPVRKIEPVMVGNTNGEYIIGE